MRARHEQCQKASDTGHGHVDQVEAGPFGRAEGGVNDHEYDEDRQGHNDRKPPRGRFWLLYSPSQPIW